MNGMSVVSASKARSNFYSLLDEVANSFTRVVITNKGSAQAVLLSPEEVNSWEETMEIMSDKKFIAGILKSEKERKAGEGISEDKVFKELGIKKNDL